MYFWLYLAFNADPTKLNPLQLNSNAMYVYTKITLINTAFSVIPKISPTVTFFFRLVFWPDQLLVKASLKKCRLDDKMIICFVFVYWVPQVYDYESIMHYGTRFFSKNDGKTIRAKEVAGSLENSIGKSYYKRDGPVLSTQDVLETNLLYKCTKITGR